MNNATLNRVWTNAGPIDIGSNQASEHIQEVEESAAASVADPTPMGLTALGLTVLFFGAIYTFLRDPMLHTAVLVPTSLVLGGGAMLLASMWAMRKGTTYQATLFGILSAFWVSWGVMQLMTATRASAVAASATLSVESGVFYLLWGAVAISLGVAGMRYSNAVAASVGLLGLSWLCMCISSWAGVTGWFTVGGILAIISGILALYEGFAYIYDTVRHKEVLPVGSRAPQSSRALPLSAPSTR